MFTRFYSFSSSRNYFSSLSSSSSSSSCEIIIRERAMKKAKTQQKNSCSSDNLPQNNTQLTEREFRRIDATTAHKKIVPLLCARVYIKSFRREDI